MSHPAVGVVVLSWNAPIQVAAAARSALAQDYAPLFVVVVDNASSPVDREAMRRALPTDPRVEVVCLKENRGYAGGNNIGAWRALERGAEFLLILTQDAQLKPGALRPMVDVAVGEGAGLVGPRVMQSCDERIELSCGEHLSLPLLCLPRRLLRPRYRGDAPRRVSGLMGCVLLISRGCWEDLGGFEAAFFAYYEEVDFCVRAKRRGWGIWCAPGATALHDGMRGFAGGFSPQSAELKARNLLWIMRRHARPADWLLLFPSWLALMAGSLMLYSLRRRFDVVRALLRGVARGCGPLLGS